MLETRFEPQQLDVRPCAYCHALFIPKRPAQSFCGPKCRNGFHMDIGIEGDVVSVRRINRGASVVIHLSGAAAESALDSGAEL